MTRVTSKLQVTIPKAIAEQYGIEPGGDIEWLPAGDAVRVVPRRPHEAPVDRTFRLALFDAATERQRRRQRGRRPSRKPADRGWTREELYSRGRAG